MLWLALGFILLGIVIGGAGFKRQILSRGSWRPGAGLLALAALIGAVVAGMRQAWPAAIFLILLFVYLAVNARARPTRRASGPSSSESRSIRKAGMGLEEAASMLGVPVEASTEEIQSAYLRLMRVVHPDRGGATGLAVQLNRARDVMLEAKRRQG